MQCEVVFSPRLRSSLGRCKPGVIRLHLGLKDEWSHLLPEVLCHEYAHLAVLKLFGPDAKAHGPEWADLVRRAGFEPRRRFPIDEKPTPPMTHLHRCPVCHATYRARTRRKLWTCATCSVPLAVE